MYVRRKCTCTTNWKDFRMCITAICYFDMLLVCFCIFFIKFKLWSNRKHFMAFLTKLMCLRLCANKLVWNLTMAKATFIAFLCINRIKPIQCRRPNFVYMRFDTQRIHEIVCRLINFKWCLNGCLFCVCIYKILNY